MSDYKELRMTAQRSAILEALRKLDRHPTADELYAIVRKQLPRISLGTVYRNLEVLSRMGLIRRLELGGQQKRFDARPEVHQHIICVECGRIDDLTSAGGITQCDRDMLEEMGYELIERRVEFFGICPGCRKAREEFYS
jgi:Fur family ferric uptake transcriptional regulator